jgi:peptidoglycan/xylan/chitin deacetylase (PgdA/CDA1 family)
MNLLGVNFHYIYDENKYPYEGIYSTSVDRLEKIVMNLQKVFEFISSKQLLQAIESGSTKRLPPQSCLITFDDGLKDQFTNGLRLLEKYKIPCSFFINTIPLAEKEVCLIHKTHYLRSVIAPDDFYSDLISYLEKNNLEVCLKENDIKNAAEQYKWDIPNNQKLKYFMNFLLPQNVLKDFIDDLFRNTINDIDIFIDNFYMNKEDIRYVHSKYNSVGLHSHSHYSLAKQPFEEMRKEILLNKDILETICNGDTIKAISYPYGGSASYSMEVVEECRKNGLIIGLTMEHALNRSLNAPLMLARLDCNDVPGGKYPKISINENQFKIIKDIRSSRDFDIE